ncbi:MAG TPA: Uma2 family endonuclease [Thermoanaerobaculia bacterium]|nr:Uma2 family endonuclease [Thermoanaerobaculia bacterium]
MSPTLLAEVPLAPPLDLGPFRLAEYEAWPEGERCELLFGTLYAIPSPSPRHQLAALLLWRRLHELALSTGGLALAAPVDVVLAEHSVVQPDVIYVSGGRLGIVREQRIEGAPDLVVEVVSPGSARRDRDEKLRLYADAGVREYWLVDPAERQIEILVAVEGEYRVQVPVGGDYRSRVTPQLRLDLIDFWRELEAAFPRS